MKKVVILLLCFAFEISGVLAKEKKTVSEISENKILVATFSGIISPVAAEYLGQSIEKANIEGYKAVIIRLDTPGGLDPSMREIVKQIMGSDVPVVLYVSPSGARAASAGVFITMSAHVAVMAPGTNIGAAHPVMIGSIPVPAKEKDKKDTKGTEEVMTEKVLKDASAYIKSIAQKRGRNVDWAVKAVTESESISAREAVKLNVIDFIADDLNDLLEKLHGREIAELGKISTKNATLVYFDPTLRQKFLAAITDPNVAMILMSLGAAGIFIEMYNPGLILPGVVGAVSLILAFYSFNTLSANFAGILLILLGFLFFIAEIKVTSYGLLSAGGIIAVILGVIMLFSKTGGIGISYSIIVSSIAILIAVTFVLGYIVVRAQRRRTVTGAESLPGKIAIAQTTIDPEGKIFVEGEIWNAKSAEGKILAGEKVKIEKVEGFVVIVRKVSG